MRRRIGCEHDGLGDIVGQHNDHRLGELVHLPPIPEIGDAIISPG
jgi:hypothetical protein